MLILIYSFDFSLLCYPTYHLRLLHRVAYHVTPCYSQGFTRVTPCYSQGLTRVTAVLTELHPCYTVTLTSETTTVSNFRRYSPQCLHFTAAERHAGNSVCSYVGHAPHNHTMRPLTFVGLTASPQCGVRFPVRLIHCVVMWSRISAAPASIVLTSQKMCEFGVVAESFIIWKQILLNG